MFRIFYCSFWMTSCLPQAMQGFLQDLEKVGEVAARAGLLEGEYKGKAKELEEMNPDQVMEAFKQQSLAVNFYFCGGC